MKKYAPLRIISYLAIAIYLFFGLYLLITPGVFSGISPVMQKAFAIVLMVYGVFRLWLIIQQRRYENFKKTQTDEDNN